MVDINGKCQICGSINALQKGPKICEFVVKFIDKHIFFDRNTQSWKRFAYIPFNRNCLPFNRNSF